MEDLLSHSTEQTTHRRKQRVWLWIGTAALLCTPPFLYFAREPLLVAAAQFLTIDNAEKRADFLVVLGGNAETRPFAAAALYRSGVAPKVLIFEHKTDRITDLGLAPTSDELYRKVLELEGVPIDAIERLPGVVDSSWDEARSLRRFLVSNPARRIILVTSAEHTRRARWVFRNVLAGIPTDIRMAPARHLEFDETNWWKHDAGVLAYIHEYLKLVFYVTRYGWWRKPIDERP